MNALRLPVPTGLPTPTRPRCAVPGGWRPAGVGARTPVVPGAAWRDPQVDRLGFIGCRMPALDR